ncbi:DNA cytosine methyltransferase [Paenibacillus polymyxa]|nr:DNA cytosine methyltransferase [Paenibacillus polymyxa]
MNHLKLSMTSRKLTAIDLFAGAGGLSQALKSTGFSVLGAIEYEKTFASTYQENHGDHVWVGDITDVNCSDFAEKFNVVPRELDLLAGCSPCQGFSKQFKYKKNKKNRVREEDPRNLLVFQYLRFVLYFQPKYLFFENVPGIVAHPWIFRLFVSKLSSPQRKFPGYNIRYETINAADYGVPQRRKRFVLLGKRKDIFGGQTIEEIFPAATHGDPTLLDGNENIQPWVTLEEAIGHLPRLEAGQIDNSDPLHFAKKISEINKIRLTFTPHNGGSRKDWPDYFIALPPETGIAPVDLWLSCHKKGEKKVGYGDVYGRMNYSTVSSTLTGGCLSITKGRFAHPIQDRAISAREAALIQTFPSNYIFKGSKEKIAIQIGNAVPVKMGETFAEHIKKDWICIEKEYSEINHVACVIK